MDDSLIRLGVSACLLGERVRYDGGHKRDAFVADTLGQWFEWVPVCPEVEVGMGIPRPSLHLTGVPTDPRMVETVSGVDWTDRMKAWREPRIEALALDGYVLKSRSPSCGLDVELQESTLRAPGLFVAALLRRWPDLPVEEEWRLHDAAVRDRFVGRVLAYHARRTGENSTG